MSNNRISISTFFFYFLSDKQLQNIFLNGLKSGKRKKKIFLGNYLQEITRAIIFVIFLSRTGIKIKHIGKREK